jgi:lambda family phage tail tape measure protein
MADLNYTIDINGTPAINTLKKIETQVKSVNDTFGKLKNALAGLALGAFTSGALRMADAISDLSDATGIAVSSIMGFSNAVAQNGGDADKAQQSLNKFVLSIAEAADGGVKAQLAFQDLDITLSDLQKLTEQELFEKAIKGLSQIDDISKRAKISAELFGKGLRGVNLKAVGEGYEAAAAGSKDYADAIKSAAATQQQLEVTLNKTRIALLTAIKPLLDFINGLNVTIDTIVNVIKVMLALGTAILAISVWGRVVQVLVGAFTLLAAAAETVGGFILTLSLRLSSMGRVGAFISDVLANIALLFNKLVTSSPMLAQGIAYIGTAIQPLIGLFAGAAAAAALFWDKVKNFLGMGGGTNKVAEDMKKQAEAAREVEDAFAKQRKAIELSSAAFRKQNNEIIDNINLEKSFIGKSEEHVEIIKAQEAIYKRAADETEKLRNARDALGKDEQKLVPIYDAQIEKIKEQTQVDVARITASLSGLQDLRLLEQDRLNNLQRISDAMEKQKDIAGTTSGIFSTLSKSMNEIEFGKSQRGKSIFEQQRADIERNIQLLEADMAGAIMAAFETEDGYTNIQQMNTELAKMYQLTEQLKQSQLGELDLSRQWATGWQDAFAKYTDSATNAATMAGNAFNSITQNMNSAIDNFVETGKFKFGDFARSVIQDLIKIELKAQASKMLSGASNMLGSFVGSLFGFAEGGNPPVNKPSIVGEKGPELFVPKTAGTIIPNGGSVGNAAQGNTYITNNISAIDAKSVAQLFAENRKTLFGSVQMAQKELSYGR